MRVVTRTENGTFQTDPFSALWCVTKLKWIATHCRSYKVIKNGFLRAICFGIENLSKEVIAPTLPHTPHKHFVLWFCCRHLIQSWLTHCHSHRGDYDPPPQPTLLLQEMIFRKFHAKWIKCILLFSAALSWTSWEYLVSRVQGKQKHSVHGLIFIRWKNFLLKL